MAKGIALDKINSWDDFKSYAEAMPNTKSMGDAFEHLTKLYFQLNPLYRSMYDNVWLLGEVPSKILEHLEIPRQDLGIDLIAQRGSEYHAIQCKYHSNKDTSVNNKEVATFTSLLANKKKLSQGYICSTAIKTSANYNKLDIQNISDILYDTWSTLDQEFFDNARKILEKKKPKVTPFVPKPHQENAIKLAHKHFVKENNSRGKLIFPCGSGKSLTGFWMMEKLKANSTLVAVPSLSLVKQTLEVYLKQVVAKNKKVKWLCICSDEGIGKSDDVVTYTRDLPVPCTTDPVYIKEWLKNNKDENIIIFTTYQSGRLIAEASKSLKFTFDLGVYDEAHKTVGKNENLFSYLLFEENISVKHRIFMTATERFYRGVRDDVLTMDDPDDYGDVFCHMSFKEAIEEDLLTDYKIITIEVKKEEIAEFIKDNNLVKSNAKWAKENEARSLASMIALRKAMKTLPIKNAVSFHSSIERATRNKEVQKHITESYGYKPIDTYHVSGKLPTTKRNDIVQEFAKSDRALITNSRCLTEGVDVPNIDCIVFADPRKSKVDIVQALGRALRKKQGKDWGYVVLPVVYDHKTHEIDNDNFQEILNIVRGLAANDERIIEYFKDKTQNGGIVKGERGDIFRIDPDLLEESELIDNLNVKLWENLSRFNWMPFEDARKFTRSLKLKTQDEWIKYWQINRPDQVPRNPNKVYKNEWISTADWLGSNIGYNRKVMSFKKARDYVRRLNIKSQKEFFLYVKTDEKPNDLPRSPHTVYEKSGWKSWSDFLGHNSPYDSNRDFLNFNEARKITRTLGFKSERDWREYCKSGKKPLNIPSNPQKKYKGEWISFADFLNYEGVAYSFMSFKDARKFVRELNLQTVDEWRDYCKSGGKPKNIPNYPEGVYSKDGWTGFGDWLGTGRLSNRKRKYKSFTDARKFVRELNLKSQNDWRIFIKSENRPKDIPSSPNKIYKNEGWAGLGDWIGNGRLATQNRVYKTFLEARAFVRRLGLKSTDEWYKFSKSEKKPNDIPATPNSVYKSDWISYPDWIGTKPEFNGKFLSFQEAKTFAKSLNISKRIEWIEYYKENKKGLYNIPSKPDRKYKAEWKGWADFLGKED